MAYSITQFENNLQNSLAALDNNFITIGAVTPIPCAISGTNSLTLTQSSPGLVPTQTISAYTTGMLFTGIASNTNTGAVSATVGSTGVLNVYRDLEGSGPTALSGGEIVQGCMISLYYDAALNSGAGGFHLVSNTANNNAPAAVSSLQVAGGSTLTNQYSGTSPTLTFSATPGWSSQDQTFSVTVALGSGSLLPTTGDFVQVNPPSLGATGIDFRGYVIGSGSLSLSSVSQVSCATINVRLLNAASASLASNSGVYRYVASRYTP